MNKLILRMSSSSYQATPFMSLSKEDCDCYFIAFKTMRRKGRSRTSEERKFPSLLARVILLMASVDSARVQSERTFLFDCLTGQMLSNRASQSAITYVRLNRHA
jgi:hypothetical protein